MASACEVLDELSGRITRVYSKSNEVFRTFCKCFFHTDILHKYRARLEQNITWQCFWKKWDNPHTAVVPRLIHSQHPNNSKLQYSVPSGWQWNGSGADSSKTSVSLHVWHDFKFSQWVISYVLPGRNLWHWILSCGIHLVKFIIYVKHLCIQCVLTYLKM